MKYLLKIQFSCFLGLCLTAFLMQTGVAQAQENLIPRPQEIHVSSSDKFYLKDAETAFNIQYFEKESRYLLEQYKKLVLKKGKTLVSGQPNYGSFRFEKLDSLAYPGKHDYYELKVGSTVVIAAVSARAALYGVETFIQLVKENLSKGSIPQLEIKDWAKFPYRGMHLDVSRHFFSVAEVKQYLDYLAAFKINKFHWHLTDDQGWRIEIKSHPKLTEIGAYRKIKEGQHYTADKIVNGKYGGFYTQEQIKEVVAYASKLHIDVIPEIEMPGHAQAAISAYPELSCTGGPFEVWSDWGVSPDIYCPKEETFALLEDVLDEVIALFPSKLIHIGGDEAPKTRWKSCAYCQALIKSEGLKDEHELQSYFIKRIEKYINSKGRQIIGWDEILEGGLAPNATVMSWTGMQGAVHAAKQGNDAIMTPVSHMYFDYYQGNPQTEPLAFNSELRLSKVYSFNPIPQELNEQEAKHILGPQANLWTEYIQDFKHVEYMIFPRLFALSEVGWGTSKASDYANFEKRVIHHFKYLDDAGIAYSKAVFEVGGSVFSKGGTNYFELKTPDPKQKIRYTTDGTTPTIKSLLYEKPILINKSMTIKAAGFVGQKKVSSDISQEFLISKSTAKSIVLESQPSEPYLANGVGSLVDGVFGHPNSFKTNWLGFNGNDLVATIDLGKEDLVQLVSLHTLDAKESWIHAPSAVTVSLSMDGHNFKEVKTLTEDEILKLKGQLKLPFTKQKTRFVKVKVKNKGVIPVGYVGAGSPAWLFVDELNVQ